MTSIPVLDWWGDYVTYEITCPNRTIAEHMYSLCKYQEDFYTKLNLPFIFRDYKTDGKTITITTRWHLTDSYNHAHLYGLALETLAKLFRIEINPTDYPIEHVRIHKHYAFKGMAGYVYNHSIASESYKCPGCKISDLAMEEPDTVSFTLKNPQQRKYLSSELSGAENAFLDLKGITQKPQKIKNDSLERSTHALITSICITIMMFGLLKNCSLF